MSSELKFEQIVKTHGIQTLHSRGRDALDFHDLHVTTLTRMLQAAYDLGWDDANKDEVNGKKD